MRKGGGEGGEGFVDRKRRGSFWGMWKGGEGFGIGKGGGQRRRDWGMDSTCVKIIKETKIVFGKKFQKRNRNLL